MKIINLTGEIKSEVQAHQKKLSAALAAFVGANKRMDKLTQQEEKLSEEIADLESSDPGNAQAIQSLSAKRTELELVQRRISETPPSADLELEHDLKFVLQESTQMIKRILMPTYEKRLAEIQATLRPFYNGESWAKGGAMNTHEAISLAQSVSRDYFRHGAPLPNAKEALKRYDQILAGEWEWQFNANLA